MAIAQRNLYLLQKLGFEDTTRSRRALDMLMINRRNEFRELAESILRDIPKPILVSRWDEFILSICLDVKEAFDSWTGKKSLSYNSDLKALTILRQFGKGKTSMIHLTHLLNLAYTIAEEFRVIYKRID